MLLNFPIELDVKTYLIRLKRLITYTVYRNQDFLYELRKVYKNKNKLFSEGIFICSIGNASKDTIKKYINSQG